MLCAQPRATQFALCRSRASCALRVAQQRSGRRSATARAAMHSAVLVAVSYTHLTLPTICSV
eukprot:3283316-Alexandrium_andersonii.AAC.1